MDMQGEYRIPLPQDAVWRGLNDPAILKASLPGCEELTQEADGHFKARIFAAVGPVKARFAGEATLSEIDPPNGYVLSGSGSGGPAGMAKGGAKVRLRTEGAETILTYEIHAQVAGKLAQIGSRLVDMAAKKMADDFFGNFTRAVQAPPKQTSTEQSSAEIPVPLPEMVTAITPAIAETVPQSAAKRPAWIQWVLLAIAAVIAAGVFLMRYV